MSLTATPLALWKASSRRPFVFSKAFATVSVTVADTAIVRSALS